MSSVRLSVSGQRSLTTTLNAPEVTSAVMPTKADDKASVQIGNATEIRMILPRKARLELVAAEKDGELGQERYLRLVIPGGGASLGVFVDAPAEGAVGSWPHFSIDIGKHLRDMYTDYAVVETIHEQVDELIPETDS